MKIAIACDHAGFEYKERVVKHLQELGHEVKDFGAYSAESMAYADSAHPMAFAVESGEYERGIAHFKRCGVCKKRHVNSHQKLNRTSRYLPNGRWCEISFRKACKERFVFWRFGLYRGFGYSCYYRVLALACTSGCHKTKDKGKKQS